MDADKSPAKSGDGSGSVDADIAIVDSGYTNLGISYSVWVER